MPPVLSCRSTSDSVSEVFQKSIKEKELLLIMKTENKKYQAARMGFSYCSLAKKNEYPKEIKYVSYAK